MSAAGRPAPRIHPKIAHLAVPVDSLTPYPGNARRHADADLAASLTTNGQYRPIVVNTPGRVILAGNGTWAEARRLGWTEIAATWVDVGPQQAARINAVDNRLGDLAGYDDRALAEQLGQIDDLAGTGYTPADLDDLLASLEEAMPPLPHPEGHGGGGAPTGSAGDNGPADPAEGNRRQQTSLHDLAETYDDRSARIIVLSYDRDRYVWVVERLARLARERGLDSNAAVVLALVARACGEAVPDG